MPEASLRVLHIAETIRGGVATVMRHLMEAQLKDERIARCAALVPAEHVKDMVGIPAEALYTFPRSGRNLKSLLALAFATWRALKQTQPTVVHLHSTFAGVLVRPLLLLLPKKQRPKVVYCPHAWAFMMAGNPLKQKLYAWVERSLLPLTDTVICVSNYERNLAAAFGLPTDKMVVIYNGVPVPATPPKRKKSTGQGPIQALFVGRLDRQKGFDVLYAAMQQIPPEKVHLCVIGEAVHGAPVPPPLPNITYRGWQTPQQVAEAMQQADVLVMPSRWEGFAMVPLEAMAHGCAVLASNVCSLPEVIENEVTGILVAPESTKELVKALGTITKASWHAMGQTAAEKISKKFMVDGMVNQTTKVYEA